MNDTLKYIVVLSLDTMSSQMKGLTGLPMFSIRKPSKNDRKLVEKNKPKKSMFTTVVCRGILSEYNILGMQSMSHIQTIFMKI